MPNLLPEKQFSRLRESVNWSQRMLEYPRKKRVEAIRQFVGYHYSDNAAPKRVPVNMLALAIQIYVRQLAARSPRVLITTKKPDLKPIAANLELAINQIPDEIGLSTTLRQLVMEAMFSVGVVKCGLNPVGSALEITYGNPFVDIVTLDDYFIDMTAKRRDQIDYEGNDYWMSYDEVKESKIFDKSVTGNLKPDEYTVIGARGERRAEEIAADGNTTPYIEKVWLRDVWIPSERILVTYGVKSEKLLNVVEWDGPDHGPYYILGFTDVPGNIMPLPPSALWLDLHELANSLFRKLGNQADGQKTVLGFSGGNTDSIEDFKKAADGEGILYSGSEPRPLIAGGVDPKTLAFYMQCRDLFSYFGGNLDSLGGLSPQTQTVGQDRLLGEAAGAQLRDMSDRVVDVVREIFRALAWYEWHDPLKSRILEKTIPGTNMKMNVPWREEFKQGEFPDYDLKIDVYSMQDDSPQLKLQKLVTFVERIVTPLAPLIQQAQGQIDVQKIIENAAHWSGLNENEEIVTFIEPSLFSQQQGPSQQEGLGMPAHTTREYIRKGRPGMSREGGSAALQQVLMGGNPGGAEQPTAP